MKNAAATYQQIQMLQQERKELRLSFIQKDIQIEQSMQSLLADLSSMFINDTTISPSQSDVAPIVNTATDDMEVTPESPCISCDKYDDCKESCDKMNAMLPKTSAGSGYISIGLGELIEEISDSQSNSNDQSYLKEINRERADSLFAAYQNCPVGLFSKREWEIVTLRIKEGHKHREISQKLGIAISTVSDTCRRAKQKMEEHYVSMRQKA